MFQHCEHNGVSYVCWLLYRKDKSGAQKIIPYRSLLIDYLQLREYVEEKRSCPEYIKRNQRIKTDKDGSKFSILLLDAKEVYDICGIKQTITCSNTCKVRFPDDSTLCFSSTPMFDPPEEIKRAMEEIDGMGLRLGSPIIQFVPEDNEGLNLPSGLMQ